jgi:acid stress-induced BolA-like protein IbaG/YrbA
MLELELMDIKEKVKQVLLRLDVVDPEVRILDGFGYRVVALVISSSFEGMPDGDRQHMVWGKLLDSLTEREQAWVEFVFTKAPSEYDPSRNAVTTSV